MRNITVIIALALIADVMRCWPQEKPHLNTYFKDYIGLSSGQIKAIRSGKAVAKTLRSRTPAEIFVFGAIYIHARPEAYVRFSRDFDRLRTVPGYLAIGEFSSPPEISNLKGFALDSEEIKSLKTCKPGECPIQMPAASIEEMQQSTDWSAADLVEHVNQVLEETALGRLTAYQREGNQALGVYDDKRHSVDVAAQFQYMLSYSRALPERLPDFYNYLLSYPRGRPANVEDRFYWAKVEFGLKPTLRIVHVVTRRGSAGGDPAYVIAEKQLYASHYFRTALDLTFCISKASNPEQPGFYLIKAMGSEQAGLTGFKGSIVRQIALDRSASSLGKSLAGIKAALEHNLSQR